MRNPDVRWVEKYSKKAVLLADSPNSSQPDRLALLLFGLLVFANGGVSIAIRFTCAELEPFWGAAARFWLGAIMFWAITAGRRIPISRARGLAGAVLYGFLSFGGAILLLYWGLTRTPASLYQILMASAPLLTLLFAGLQASRRFGFGVSWGASWQRLGLRSL